MYQPSINFDIFKWSVMLDILNGIDWSLWKLKDLKPMGYSKSIIYEGKKKNKEIQ